MKGVFNASVFIGRPLYPADITTTVSVYNAETDELVPTLWLDRDGIDELANPHPLAEDGVILFYADPGRYNIVVEKGTQLYREWPDVIISDSATSGTPGIQSIVAGTNVTVDDTDPLNPVVSATGGGGGVNLSVTELSIVSGVVTVDLSLGSLFTLDMSANVTEWNFTNTPGEGNGGSIMILVIQGDPARTLTLNEGSAWTDGSLTDLDTEDGTLHLLAMTSFDNWATVGATMGKLLGVEPPDPESIYLELNNIDELSTDYYLELTGESGVLELN